LTLNRPLTVSIFFPATRRGSFDNTATGGMPADDDCGAKVQLIGCT